MVATVVFDGFGSVSAADSTTGWTALKIAGTGGGPTIAVADGQIEGTGAVTAQVSRQHVAIYYDIGAGNELDFTGGGAQEGQMVYIWANFLAAALLNNQSAGGFGVFLESSAPGTAQYHEWYFEGADTYAGGWRRFILDPTKTASTSAGTAINLASVRYLGVFADVGGTTARFDNLICDAVDVGTGIRIYGTSTVDDTFGDILADEVTNRYGVVTALNSTGSAIELAGKLEFGDNVSTNAATLTDVDKKIFVAEPLYYDGTSVVPSVPTDYFTINFVGNGTGDTSVTWGKKVGTGDSANGRNGLTIIGNDTYDVSIDFDDGSVETCLIYGSTFETLTGTLSWGTNTAHECIGNTFNGCSQFDPVGGIEIRACVFVNYDLEFAALLWNASIDIKNSSFIANAGDDAVSPRADSAGIQHTFSGTVTYDGLSFSGNDFDIYYSAPDGTLTVNATNGTNAGTSRIDGAGSPTPIVDIQNSVNLTFNGIISGSRLYVELASGGPGVAGTVIYNDIITVDPFSFSRNFVGDQPILYRVRKGSSAPYYQPIESTGTITSSGFSVVIQQVSDE